MSRETGGQVRDAIFVFDMRGTRCAATPGADEAVGGGPVERLTDLLVRFRQPDGLPLDLDEPGTRVAVDVDGKSGSRVTITTEALAEGGGGDCAPAFVVSVRPFRAEDDPVTVQHALGSVLAHELRTPLTTIVGGAQLVSNAHASAGIKEEAATSVVREAHRLNRVVDDLIVLVRAGRDPAPELEPVMLQHLLPGVIAAERQLHPDAVIEVSVQQKLPPVLACEAYVGQALRNLLDHAVQYAPRGAEVRVDARRSNGNVAIRVTDGGPSRDAAAAGRAFDLFAKSPRTTMDPSGANLGLVVAHQLVVRMGGRLTASGASPGGDVTFTLPVARATR